MGRSMIIIVMGVMLTIGIMQTSIFGTIGGLNQTNVDYAENVQAANMAHTGAELAIRQLRDDPSWRTSEWVVTTNQGNATVSVTTIDADTLRVISTGSANDGVHTVRYTLLEAPYSLVPQFKAAMGIYTDNFIFSIDGAAARIDGADVSETCETVPGVGVNTETAKAKVGEWSNIHGDPTGEAGILTDSHEWEDVQKLIDNLAPLATKVTRHISDFGSPEYPGVFVVEDQVKLTGGTPEGFGILIIRSDGELELEGGLDLTGNFTFNGLVIFENAYNLDARGTPTINGSIMIGGNTDTDVPIHIRGSVEFNYDCSAQDLADRAYQNAGASMRFTTLSVFE